MAIQARLGHADAAITLREYAYALPLTDGETADAIDAHLHQVEADEPAASESTGSTSKHPECFHPVGPWLAHKWAQEWKL